MNEKGVVYIHTNPSFLDYVIIGYADDIDKRLKQLKRSECIPFAFRVYATYEVNLRLSDLKLYAIIDKLNPDLRQIDDFNGQKRICKFYAIKPEEAYAILEAMAEIYDCKEKSKILDLVISGQPMLQNPYDELASVLLECIRVEKENWISIPWSILISESWQLRQRKEVNTTRLKKRVSIRLMAPLS